MIRQNVDTTAHDSGIAVANLGTGDVSIVRGYAISLAAFEAYARQLDVTEDALAHFFQILERKSVPPERLDQTLREIAAHYTRLRSELAAFRPSDEALNLKRDQANAALDAGDFDEAERLLLEVQQSELKARAAAQQAFEIHSLSAAKAGCMRADILLTQLRFGEAADVLADVANIVPAGEEELLLGYLNRWSEAERLAGRFDRAREAGRRAVRSAELGSKPDMAASILALRNLGLAFRELGDYAHAEKSLREAVEAAGRLTDKDVLLGSLTDLATVIYDQGRLKEAEFVQNEAHAAAEGLGGAETAAVARFWHALGRLNHVRADYPAAEGALLRALEIRRKVLPPDHPDIGRTLNDVAFL